MSHLLCFDALNDDDNDDDQEEEEENEGVVEGDGV